MNSRAVLTWDELNTRCAVVRVVLVGFEFVESSVLK